MIAEALKVPLLPDYIGHLETHFVRDVAGVVEDWSRCINVLTEWEDEHLLDNPAAEKLAAHKQTIERLLRFGRLIALATEPPDFPDKEVAAIVSSTQSCLRDKLSLWHGNTLTETQRDDILRQCFNEP